MKRLLPILLVFGWTTYVHAEEVDLQKVQVETDRQSIERGIDTLMETCHTCHNLKYVKYRDLAALGIAKEKIDGWRGDQPLDAPLTGMMSDESAMQTFAKIPPDLSLMVKARDGEENYLYSYLVGYYNKPDGTTSNHVFPETKMPDPLGISTAADDKSRKEIQDKARDVVSFLYWAADPHEQERHRLGYYVIGYLLVLTVLLYFLKQQIWSRLD